MERLNWTNVRARPPRARAPRSAGGSRGRDCRCRPKGRQHPRSLIDLYRPLLQSAPFSRSTNLFMSFNRLANAPFSFIAAESASCAVASQSEVLAATSCVLFG